MSTANTPASPASPQTPSQLNGGLFLSGMVIAVRTEDKVWEKEAYRQTIVSISDGERVFLMRHKHDGNGFIPPVVFTPIKIRVTYCATDKGQISVQGVIEK